MLSKRYQADNYLMLTNFSTWAVLTATALLAPTSTPIEEPKPTTSIESVSEVQDSNDPITASADAKVSFDRVPVTTIAAPPPPPPPAPEPEPEPEPVEEAPAPVAATPAPAAKRSAVAAVAAPVPAPAAKPIAVSPGSAQAEAAAQMQAYGWGADQLNCLINLWEKESNWNFTAQNPSSGAYGIPQSLPGTKMASAGADWRTNPATQIKWGLGYISERYKTPCGAWGHSVAVGWY